MRTTLLLFPVLLTLLAATSCQNTQGPPKLVIYAQDSTFLPMTVYLDDSCIGTVRAMPELTERMDDGTMIPAYGAEGTISMEISEGFHTTNAVWDYIDTGDIPTNAGSNLTNAIPVKQAVRSYEFEAFRGARCILGVDIPSGS